MKTYIPKQGEIARSWVLVDAEGQRLGRMASRIAVLLRGKHRPIFTPHLDVGDWVVVVNADRVVLSGRKSEQKRYYSHSTHPGGLRVLTFRQVTSRKPEWIVRRAVWGMLPHNRLGRKLIRKLKVYAGPDHPHSAQRPTRLNLSPEGETQCQ